MHRRFGSIMFIAALLYAPAHGHAEPPGKQPVAGKSTKAAQPAPKADKAADEPKIPGTTKLTLLIQIHMAALSQAIQTENYSVLHALGAPDFQKGNSIEKLSKTFGKFKAEGLDFSPVILFVPVLVQPPALDSNGLLRLKGYYKTEPQKVDFDMLFQNVNGAWRIYGISAQARPADQGADTVLQVQPDGATQSK